MTNPVSARAIAKIRVLRRLQGLSAEKLAAGMTEAGYLVQRQTITNAEMGRRREIPVDFLAAAAAALGTTPAALLGESAGCPVCGGEPPAGYTCNACGTAVGG